MQQSSPNHRCNLRSLNKFACRRAIFSPAAAALFIACGGKKREKRNTNQGCRKGRWDSTNYAWLLIIRSCRLYCNCRKFYLSNNLSVNPSARAGVMTRCIWDCRSHQLCTFCARPQSAFSGRRGGRADGRGACTFHFKWAWMFPKSTRHLNTRSLRHKVDEKCRQMSSSFLEIVSKSWNIFRPFGKIIRCICNSWLKIHSTGCCHPRCRSLDICCFCCGQETTLQPLQGSSRSLPTRADARWSRKFNQGVISFIHWLDIFAPDASCRGSVQGCQISTKKHWVPYGFAVFLCVEKKVVIVYSLQYVLG
jgi:hypothetical protein